MLTFAPPCDEVGHQIACVETFAGDEASSESESYGGVIGAFGRARVKGAAGHLGVVGEGITGGELRPHAQGVTHSKAEEAPLAQSSTLGVTEAAGEGWQVRGVMR